MDFTKTIIPLALMASESIAHSAAIDSELIRARGIIVKQLAAEVLQMLLIKIQFTNMYGEFIKFIF